MRPSPFFLLVLVILSVCSIFLYLGFRHPSCPPMRITRTEAFCGHLACYMLVTDMNFLSGSFNNRYGSINGGIEQLLSYELKQMGYPYAGIPTCDTDKDGMPEYADAYGNPLILILTSDKVTVKSKEGTEFDVQLEGIEQGKSFALWSMGPNGVNEYGLGDDIGWRYGGRHAGWTCWWIEKGEIVEEGVFKAGIEWTKGERPENPSDK